MEPKGWHKPAQLAQDHQLKIANIYKWIDSGELEAVNLSRGSSRPRWRISEAAWADFLRRRKNTPAKPTTRRNRVTQPCAEYV